MHPHLGKVCPQGLASRHRFDGYVLINRFVRCEERTQDPCHHLGQSERKYLLVRMRPSQLRQHGRGIAGGFCPKKDRSPNGLTCVNQGRVKRMPIAPESHGREQRCNSIGVNDQVSQFDESSQILRRVGEASLCGVRMRNPDLIAAQQVDTV
jgi:hypothetical protein